MAKIATVLRNRHFAVHKITLNPNFVKLTSLTDAPQKTDVFYFIPFFTFIINKQCTFQFFCYAKNMKKCLTSKLKIHFQFFVYSLLIFIDLYLFNNFQKL